MLELFWICFIAGIVLSLVIVIFGEVLDGVLEGALEFLSLDGPEFLHPITLVGGMTAFGGAGILLTHWGWFTPAMTVIAALLVSVFISMLAYFIYVKPMRKAENSLAFSSKELAGKIGEVTISIPADGFGEVMIKMGAGNITEIAGSFERKDIPAGAKVVVVEHKDGVSYVSELEGDEW